MKKLIRAAFLASFLTSGAFAQVIALPSFQDLGSVRFPGQRSTVVTFQNNTALPISNFTPFCSGDLNSFNCNSSCFSLSAYGSCTVWVTFAPRNGDGQRKYISVQAMGSGVFTQAQISGTDEKN